MSLMRRIYFFLLPVLMALFCSQPLSAGRPNILLIMADDLGWSDIGCFGGPFRQFKHWTHEGGIATPLIACWPGRISAGSINRKQVGHVIDLMPTVVELAGGQFPREILLEHPGFEPDKPLARVEAVAPPEGRSLVAALFDPEHEVERTIFGEHEGNRAVRRGRWKLVAYYNENLGDTDVALGKRSGSWELYDMETDRTELRDLAALHPEIVKELAAAHRAWEQRVGVRDWESLLRMGGLDEIK